MDNENRQYRELAEEMKKRADRRGIIYLPVYRGGLACGVPLEREFMRQDTPYIRLPVKYDIFGNDLIVQSPRRKWYKKIWSDTNMLYDGCLNIIWDDVITGGSSTLTIYQWLLSNDIDRNDILISSRTDMRGITDGFSVEKCYKNPLDRDTLLEELKAKGKIRENPTLRIKTLLRIVPYYVKAVFSSQTLYEEDIPSEEYMSPDDQLREEGNRRLTHLIDSWVRHLTAL